MSKYIMDLAQDSCFEIYVLFILILFYDLLFYLFFLLKSLNTNVGCCAVFVQVGVTVHLYENYSYKSVQRLPISFAKPVDFN